MTDLSNEILTLEGLIELIKADAALPAAKARTVASAIRTFAKVSGFTLQMEASFPVFRRHIKRVKPGGDSPAGATV